MNTFKEQRDQFIRKYFLRYHESLVKGIKATNPNYHFSDDYNFIPNIIPVQIMKQSKLVDKLNNLDYHSCVQHNWEYYYQNTDSNISDWCSMYWDKDEGLCIHFELKDIYPADGSNTDLEMDESSWEFFFTKRKIIFDNFCHKFSEPPFRYEDIFLRLTDNKLNRLPVYKIGVLA